MIASHNSALWVPRRHGPYTPAWLNDGMAGAKPGRPQYPWLLGVYGPRRPPWNVAGVDYPVGVPENQNLTDWRLLSGRAGLSVNTATGQVRTLSGVHIFNNIDFSHGIGAFLYNGGGGATSITCNNCYFSLPGGGGSWSATTFAVVFDQNVADVTVNHCSFDATQMPGMGTFVSCTGNVTLTYNWFLHTRAHILEWNPNLAVKSITYKFNLVDDAMIVEGPPEGNHLNYIQNSSHTTAFTDVQFNTTYQRSNFGAEGFQYDGFSDLVLQDPILTNNTMISRPSPLGKSMSYLVHGNSAGLGAVSGTGQNNNNYFDRSGAFNAYYPATMTPALGWSSSGNIDMLTGAIITPA